MFEFFFTVSYSLVEVVDKKGNCLEYLEKLSKIDFHI